MSGFKYVGYYVNLDKSAERNANFLKQLDVHGVANRYQRFPGVCGNIFGIESKLRFGELGCYASHLMLLAENLGADCHLHVVEDDVLFCKHTVPVIENVINSGEVDKFDLIFTETMVSPDPTTVRMYADKFSKMAVVGSDGIVGSKGGFEIVDLSKLNFATTASFVVNRKSIGKVFEILRSAFYANDGCPVDLVLRRSVRRGELRAGVVFPFVTSAKLDHVFDTTIEGRRESELSVLYSSLIRYSFSIGSDLAVCESMSVKYFKEVGLGRHQLFLNGMGGYLMTNLWSGY